MSQYVHVSVYVGTYITNFVLSEPTEFKACDEILSIFL